MIVQILFLCYMYIRQYIEQFFHATRRQCNFIRQKGTPPMLIRFGNVFINSEFKQSDLRIENGLVTELDKNLPPLPDERIYDAAGCYVLPGLFDIHVHGAVGEDFSDANPEGLRRMAEYERSCGVTSFCPTTMSLGRDKLLEIFKTGRDAAEQCPEIYGFHMEGPFLNPKRKGAQKEEHIVKADKQLFDACFEASGRRIKKLTLAPEMDEALGLIREVRDVVKVSLGHTQADYACASLAFREGASHVTHLFNAMPGLNHRQPGIIGAAYDNKEVYVELIADGVHVHDSVIRAAFSMFEGRVVLVSDSMRATGLGDGEYSLGGQSVRVNGKTALLSDGTIAGSVTNLFECMRYCINIGIPIEKAVVAVTLTPATALGADKQIGTIAVGRKADIVITDDKFRLLKVL